MTHACPDLSICVVSYNTRDLLDACLASVFRSGCGAEADTAQALGPTDRAPRATMEVIVVDNASRDGSADMVREKYPQARLIALDENVGFARGSNQAIKASSGRHILLLNSDTVVQEHALGSMVAFLDEHPEFAVLGPRLLNDDGTAQPSCFAFVTVRDIIFENLGLTALFPRSRFVNRRGLGGFDGTEVREVDWVSGACLMVRRPAVERVGLLDEEFFMYGEEQDWCRRMKETGLRVVFYPGATVVHYGRASSRRARGELAPRALAGRLRYFHKHHGPRAVLAVRAATVVGMTLRLLALPVRAILRPKTDVRADFDWYWGVLRAAVGVRSIAPISMDEQDD